MVRILDCRVFYKTIKLERCRFTDQLKSLENDKLFLSDIYLGENQTVRNTASVKPDDKFQLYSRVLPKQPLHTDSTIFYYIGSNEKFLNPFRLYFNKMRFYTFENSSSLNVSMKRLLMKRYYLIEKAKDAKIFGILIGQLSLEILNAQRSEWDLAVTQVKY
jgi:diphthamide biosynthesis enzyme Dph1/Dph2-like protein